MNTLRDDLRRAYDDDVDRRDAKSLNPWRFDIRNKFFTKLREHEVQTILELGAGTGKDSLFFKEKGLVVKTTDLSPAMVQRCREKGLDAQVGDFYQLDFPDQAFDAVWAMNCLLHIPKADLPDVLREICRVLKPGGWFYMGVYGGDEEDGVYEDDFCEPKRWFTRYTDDHLREVVSSVFNLFAFYPIDPQDGGPGHHQSAFLRAPD
jgi:ubiquinone/menaquinone biosynthesis C-methylase UbiE